MHTKTTYFTINTQSVTLCTLFVIAILEMLNVICQWSKALHDTFGFKIHTTLCSIWVIVFGCVSFACSRSLVMVYAEEIFERIIRLLRSLVCLLLFRHSVRPLELCLFFYSNALAMNKYQKTHTHRKMYIFFLHSFAQFVCLFVFNLISGVSILLSCCVLILCMHIISQAICHVSFLVYFCSLFALLIVSNEFKSVA